MTWDWGSSENTGALLARLVPAAQKYGQYAIPGTRFVGEDLGYVNDHIRPREACSQTAFRQKKEGRSLTEGGWQSSRDANASEKADRVQLWVALGAKHSNGITGDVIRKVTTGLFAGSALCNQPPGHRRASCSKDPPRRKK